MNTQIIYNLFNSITISIPEIRSFYFIDPWAKNDLGDSLEYPKVVLRKPLRSNHTELRSTYNLTLEVLNVYNATASTFRSESEKEVEIISDCELLWKKIWNKLKLENKIPTGINIITIHEEGIDRYSGIEITFDLTIGNNNCV